MYWLCRYKSKIPQNLDYSPQLEEPGLLNVTIRPDESRNGNRRGGRLNFMNHSARVTPSGIYLRETRTLIFLRNSPRWHRRKSVCVHTYLEYSTSRGGAPNSKNYHLSVACTLGGPLASPIWKGKDLLISADGTDVLGLNKPFNHLHTCTHCNRELLIEKIRRDNACPRMAAGIKVSIWFCVAPYVGQSPGASVPAPAVTLHHVANIFTMPEQREQTTNMPTLAPGTCVKMFEYDDYLKQDRRRRYTHHE